MSSWYEDDTQSLYNKVMEQKKRVFAYDSCEALRREAFAHGYTNLRDYLKFKYDKEAEKPLTSDEAREYIENTLNDHYEMEKRLQGRERSVVIDDIPYNYLEDSPVKTSNELRLGREEALCDLDTLKKVINQEADRLGNPMYKEMYPEDMKLANRMRFWITKLEQIEDNLSSVKKAPQFPPVW